MPDQLLDFSVNINPLGPPAILQKKWPHWFSLIQDYPDPKAEALKKKLAEVNHIDEQFLTIGNGAAELITLIAQLLRGKKIIIIQPAFSEYEKACQAQDCQIYYHHLHEPDWELYLDSLYPKLADCDALFLCNPNNPTGIVHEEKVVRKLIAACEKMNCLLIIDEAFYDFSPSQHSYIKETRKSDKLIILRSMTKMYRVAGLRLGYLIAQPEIVRQLNKLKPHWSINAIAMQAGETCLSDTQFVQETSKYIEQERERLFTFYENYDFIISHSKVNYYLLKDPYANMQHLYTFLLKKGIVPRHTWNFPGLDGRWIRLAIKARKENDRLMEVLKEWRNHQSFS